MIVRQFGRAAHGGINSAYAGLYCAHAGIIMFTQEKTISLTREKTYRSPGKQNIVHAGQDILLTQDKAFCSRQKKNIDHAGNRYFAHAEKI